MPLAAKDLPKDEDVGERGTRFSKTVRAVI